MEISKDVLQRMYCEEKLSQREIAYILNTSQSEISRQMIAHRIKSRRVWTKEEEEYLIENLGKYSFATLAKNLDKTELSIKQKVTRLGLGGVLLSTGKLTAKELGRICDVGLHVVKRWIYKKGLKATKKVLRHKAKFYQIDIDDFWKWAKDNKELINFSRLEPGILGEEPEWVSIQRKIDFKEIPQKQRKRWTSKDDEALKRLYSARYSYQEISDILQRSKNGVKQRIIRLNLSNRVIVIPWKSQEIKTLLDLKGKGCTYKEIAYELGREEGHCAWKWQHLKNTGATING